MFLTKFHTHTSYLISLHKYVTLMSANLWEMWRYVSDLPELSRINLSNPEFTRPVLTSRKHRLCKVLSTKNRDSNELTVKVPNLSRHSGTYRESSQLIGTVRNLPRKSRTYRVSLEFTTTARNLPGSGWSDDLCCVWEMWPYVPDLPGQSRINWERLEFTRPVLTHRESTDFVE